MATSRFCRICRNWHDLDEAWPEQCLGHFGHRGESSIQIISDIQPYRAVATDIATGKAPIIGSRAEHRDFLKRNKYVEVGNEFNQGPRHKPIDIDGPGDRARRREDIRQAVREVTGRR